MEPAVLQDRLLTPLRCVQRAAVEYINTVLVAQDKIELLLITGDVTSRCVDQFEHVPDRIFLQTSMEQPIEICSADLPQYVKVKNNRSGTYTPYALMLA
jgi:hypothetical protein